jgi:hypothetical protein
MSFSITFTYYQISDYILIARMDDQSTLNI